MSQVSVIVPTLNEAACLTRSLRALQGLDPRPYEVIVVDGGSQDDTVAIAKQALEDFPNHVKTLVLPAQQRGRGPQMNRGAAAATGDVLCFLHADTLVPDDAIALIDKTLVNPGIVGGGFISLMTGADTTRWGFSLHNYLKTYYAPLIFRPHLFVRGLRLLFGDQVMFCRRQDFWTCGGFDERLPILEDAELCLRLFRQGRLHLVNRTVQSSDRRVQKWGSLKANVIYAYVGYLWGIGVSATYLKQFYEDIR